MIMLREGLQHVFVWPSENRRSGASNHLKTRKAPAALDPALRAQNTLRSLEVRAPVVYIFQLVIYLTFDVFAASPPPSSLHPSSCDNMTP